MYKTKAEIWYNKACRHKQLTPNYISIKINGSIKLVFIIRRNHTIYWLWVHLGTLFSVSLVTAHSVTTMVKTGEHKGFRRSACGQLAYFFTTCSTVLLEKLSRFSASQEILRILRNPEVHYRIHLLMSLVAEFKILILAFAWRN